MNLLTKQPAESKVFPFLFANKMATGSSINAVLSIVSDPVGTHTFGLPSFSGTTGQVMITGGVAGYYKLTMKVSTTTNEVLERDGILQIKDE